MDTADNDTSGDDEPNHDEYLRQASDSLLVAINGLISASRNGIKGISLWFEQHPLLGLIISAPISGLIAKVVFDVFHWLSTVFFRSSVTVSNDIRLGTLPFPVGLTIYLLFSLWIFTALIGYLRMANLRHRIDELETEQ